MAGCGGRPAARVRPPPGRRAGARRSSGGASVRPVGRELRFDGGQERGGGQQRAGVEQGGDACAAAPVGVDGRDGGCGFVVHLVSSAGGSVTGGSVDSSPLIRNSAPRLGASPTPIVVRLSAPASHCSGEVRSIHIVAGR